MERNDLTKSQLLEGVGQLVELDLAQINHVHLYQHKLFTLFSVSFQYMLFLSMQRPGYYLIRIQDGELAQKLAKKAKDESTRKFLTKLIHQRKLRYRDSYFVLDYFQPSTWAQTMDIPKEKIQCSVLICESVMKESWPEFEHLGSIPYFHSLLGISPRFIFIDLDKNMKYSENFTQLQRVTLSIIGPQDLGALSGVVLGKDININEL